MKTIKILILLFFLATGFSVNAMSVKPQPNNNENHNDNNGNHNDNNGNHNDNNGNHNDNNGNHNDNNGNHHDNDGNHNGNNGHHGGPVGVPLDGGLLTVLGVAGVAYYAARKKGKKQES
jgi:hypothetical protein